MKKMKPVVLSLALAALLSPLSAGALGLAGVNVKSSLYEPLRADVALRVNPGEDILGTSFVIASPAQFAQAGLAYPSWAGDLSARVERVGKTARLRLSTSKPVYEPMARLLIEARLPNGSALLPVTLMLDTPFSKPLNPELAPMLPQSVSEPATKKKTALATPASRGSAKARSERAKTAPKRNNSENNAPRQSGSSKATASSSTTPSNTVGASIGASSPASPALALGAVGAVSNSELPRPSNAGVNAASATGAANPAAGDAVAPGGSTAPLTDAASPSPSGVIAGPSVTESTPAASSEAVSLPSADEPAMAAVEASSTAPTVAPTPSPALTMERSAQEPGFLGGLSMATIGLIAGAVALLAVAVAALARRRRRAEDAATQLSVSTESYSATEDALSAEPDGSEPEPARFAPSSSATGPAFGSSFGSPFERPEHSSLSAAALHAAHDSSAPPNDASSFDRFPASTESAASPSLIKSDPASDFASSFASEDLAASLDEELNKAVSGGSASAHEIHEIDSLRSEVFSSDFMIDSSFEPRSAAPLPPTAKTREDFTFESLTEQVSIPSQETLRPILSDPDSLKAPDPDLDSNLMSFEPFKMAAPAQSDHALTPVGSMFVFEDDSSPVDAFAQAQALSDSAQNRSAPALDLGETFKVDDSVGECPGRLQLELACLYAQNGDWEGARGSLAEVLTDAESKDAHPEARRLMALIP